MLTEIIAKYIQEKRQAEIRDNSKFRVSDAGRCHLMRYWKRQGKPASDMPDDRAQRIFEVGNVFHVWLQDVLTETGRLFEKELRVEDTHRIGHIDAIVHTDKGLVLYDFKTVHSRKFHWKRKEGMNGDLHYAMQAFTYSTMLRTGVVDVRIAYISKDDLCIEEVSVLQIDDIAEYVYQDWLTLISAWERRERPTPNPAEWECKYCIYRTECLTNIETRQYVK
jgi:CRISPR/Cas system-associated exonuclease Cas4 (RecB family)